MCKFILRCRVAFIRVTTNVINTTQSVGISGRKNKKCINKRNDSFTPFHKVWHACMIKKFHIKVSMSTTFSFIRFSIIMLERSYTVTEVATHNGKNGNRVWIIIKGVVYDVTDFIDSHPGGGELILELAGKDATKAFNKAGHSTDATRDLKKYRIGTVSENSPVQAENNHKLTSSESQSTLSSNKSEKRRRIKLLFCV